MKVLVSTNFHIDPVVGGTANIVATTGLKLAQYGGLDVRLLTGDRKRYPPPGRVASFLDIARVDVVHNYGIWVPFAHGIAVGARICRKPRVWATIGALAPWAVNHRGLKKRVAMALYQRNDLNSADALQATSLGEARNVRELRISAPIAVIPHGIDAPAEEDLAKHRRAPGELRTMLLVSRIHPVKGLMNLVNAWARVRPVGWKVVIAGPDEGAHRAQLEVALARHRIHDFTFVGPVGAEQKHALYKSADLFALPSHTENFGLVVAEALSYGVPVLTTRGTPWSELDETQCGWWIEVGAEPLADALRVALASSDERLREMGRNGRRLIVDHYGWPAVVQKHVALYHWISGAGAKPAFVLD